MIDIRTAVKSAHNYLNDLRDLVCDKNYIFSPTLEEFELSDDMNFWLITLSFSSGGVKHSERKYKTFKVNSETGQVEMMKIRAVVILESSSVK